MGRIGGKGLAGESELEEVCFEGLNNGRVGAWRMWMGRAFQRGGAAAEKAEKARSPQAKRCFRLNINCWKKKKVWPCCSAAERASIAALTHQSHPQKTLSPPPQSAVERWSCTTTARGNVRAVDTNSFSSFKFVFMALPPSPTGGQDLDGEE